VDKITSGDGTDTDIPIMNWEGRDRKLVAMVLHGICFEELSKTRNSLHEDSRCAAQIWTQYLATAVLPTTGQLSVCLTRRRGGQW
jgi:hypothetical protein